MKISFIIFIILFLAESIFAILYIHKGYPHTTKTAFFCKMAASAVFVINGICAYSLSVKGSYAKTVIAALVFGLIGDAFLAFHPFFTGENREKKNRISVIIGAVFFLLGHITYMIAFLREIVTENAFRPAVFIGALAGMMAVGITVKILLKVRLKKFAFPVLIYALTLCSMCSLGICLAMFGHTGNTVTQAVLIAAPLLFVISDATIVPRMFDKGRFETMGLRYVNLGTYFLAQMLFGISVLLIR